MNDINWSKSEKQAARKAFDTAYEREIAALIANVREQASTISTVDDLWQLHDFLSARRHDLDGKYDYRYSMLIFVLARLVREGWLDLDELNELDIEKRTKIAALNQLFKD